MRRTVRRAMGGALMLAALCATEALGNQVVGFILIDADTQSEIRNIADGDTIEAAQLPTGRVNIQAVTEPRLTGSVRFDLNDRIDQRTDNTIPYVLGGDPIGGDGPVYLPAGEHTLTASPFSRSNGLGVKGQTLTVRFTMVGQVGEAPPVATPTVEEVLANALAPIAQEQNGMIVIEIESHPVADGWTATADLPDALGTAYVWSAPDMFRSPGQGTLTYLFDIAQGGEYELRWRSRIAIGEDSTEHNDTWVHFPTGHNVPEEWPIDGWTKVYQNQTGRWSWQASTKDHDPRPIRRRFDAGRHAIQISGRSHGHALDRIILFKYDEIAFDAEQFDQAAPSPLLPRPAAAEEEETVSVEVEKEAEALVEGAVSEEEPVAVEEAPDSDEEAGDEGQGEADGDDGPGEADGDEEAGDEGAGVV